MAPGTDRAGKCAKRILSSCALIRGIRRNGQQLIKSTRTKPVSTVPCKCDSGVSNAECIAPLLSTYDFGQRFPHAGPEAEQVDQKLRGKPHRGIRRRIHGDWHGLRINRKRDDGKRRKTCPFEEGPLSQAASSPW